MLLLDFELTRRELAVIAARRQILRHVNIRIRPLQSIAIISVRSSSRAPYPTLSLSLRERYSSTSVEANPVRRKSRARTTPTGVRGRNTMSRSAKIFFGASAFTAVGVIYGVHWLQRRESDVSDRIVSRSDLGSGLSSTCAELKYGGHVSWAEVEYGHRSEGSCSFEGDRPLIPRHDVGRSASTEQIKSKSRINRKLRGENGYRISNICYQLTTTDNVSRSPPGRSPPQRESFEIGSIDTSTCARSCILALYRSLFVFVFVFVFTASEFTVDKTGITARSNRRPGLSDVSYLSPTSTPRELFRRRAQERPCGPCGRV